MKFEMNNRIWEISETDLDSLRKEYTKDTKRKDEEDYYFYGLCCISSQRILLNKDIHIDKKKKTLLHELMHCYLECYVTSQDNVTFSEEAICNLFANSHYIIHEIVDKYFNCELLGKIQTEVDSING